MITSGRVKNAEPRLIAAYRALRSIEAMAMDDDDAAAWDEAEDLLRAVLSDMGVKFKPDGHIDD